MNEDGIGRGAHSGGRVKLSADGGGHDEDSSHGLSELTQKRLGIHLRAMYDTIVQQPVPDRFKDLIAKLDGAD